MYLRRGTAVSALTISTFGNYRTREKKVEVDILTPEIPSGLQPADNAVDIISAAIASSHSS